MTPEGKVKEWFKERIERRFKHTGLWMYAPPGGRFGQAGVPDRVFLVASDDGETHCHLYEQHGRPPGVFVGVEIKSGESGYTLTAIQRKRLREIEAAGGVAASLTGKDEAKVEAIFAEVNRRRAMCLSAWLNTIGQPIRDESRSHTSDAR